MAQVPRDVAELIRSRDCRECQRCCAEGKNTIHHIVRSSDGGSDDEFNLILLCRKCHDLVERLYDSGTLSPSLFLFWIDKEWHDARRSPRSSV